MMLRRSGIAGISGRNSRTPIFALPFSVLVNAARSPPLQGREVVTQEIDESRLIVLRGNTRPEANRNNDRGYVGDDFRLEHMFLQLKRPTDQEQALDQYIGTDSPTLIQPMFINGSLSDPNRRNLWGFGCRHREDHRKVAGDRNGIKVNLVYPNHLLMDISGNCGAVARGIPCGNPLLIWRSTERGTSPI